MLRRPLGLLFLGFLMAAPALSQPTYAWASASLGGGAFDRGVGLSGRAAVHLAIGRFAFVVRQTATSAGTRYDGFVGARQDEVFDTAVLAGTTLAVRDRVRLVVAGGLAHVRGTRIIGDAWETCTLLVVCVENAPSESYDAVGLAAEVALFGRSRHRLGYAVVLHANANAAEPFAGLTIGFTLGRS